MLEGKQTIDQNKRAEIYKTSLQLIYDEVPVTQYRALYSHHTGQKGSDGLQATSNEFTKV